jgi:MFS family permease
LVWWLEPTFTGFAIGFVLWGIEGAMTSGAFQALVFDELHARGEDDRYARVMGAGEAWSSGGAVLGAILAAAAVPLGFPFILVMSALACVGASVIVLSFPDAPITEDAVEHRYLHLLREGVREVVARRALLGFVLFSGLLVGLGSVEEFSGLVLRDAGIGRADISLMHAWFFLAAVAGSLLAYRVAKAPWVRVLALTVVTGAALVGAAQGPAVAAPIGLLVFHAMYGLQYVALDARLQGMITTRARATVTSVHGFVTELAAIATFGVFGVVASGTSNRTATGVIGGGFIALALVCAFVRRFLRH